jgi:polar amino acid transport system substrate-binding protein
VFAYLGRDCSLTRGDEAFAMRKGDPDGLNFLSNWILINTSNGWLQETHDYWFKDQSAWKDMVAVEQ